MPGCASYCRAVATIVGLSGSLRKASFNAALLRAAVELAPAGLVVEMASIVGIPLYNADVDRDGTPAPVAALKDRIAAADGLLLVTPEYNNSIPGVFKNVIDWLSRPPGDIPRVFGGKPVTLMGATLGMQARFGPRATCRTPRGCSAQTAASWMRPSGCRSGSTSSGSPISSRA